MIKSILNMISYRCMQKKPGLQTNFIIITKGKMTCYLFHKSQRHWTISILSCC